jgi:hypothetical protein
VEGVEVRIQAAAADDVAAGGRHARAAEARQQRPGEQERGTDALGQHPVRLGAVDGGGIDRNLRGTNPLDPRAEGLQQGDHRLDIGDPGHVAQDHLIVGEQARGQDRQRAVLVTGRRDRARQGHAAFNDELLQRDRPRCGRLRRAGRSASQTSWCGWSDCGLRRHDGLGALS